jgi:Cu/Ag efflux protein CusF
MWKRAICVAAFVVWTAAATRAETYGEKVKAVDAAKRTITIHVEGKDRAFKVDEKVDVQAQVRAGKRLRLSPVKDGLKGVKAGSEVTITTERKDGEEVVTRIVLLAPEPK